MMRKGDTLSLILNYQVNGRALQRDAYEEIELQINNDTTSKSIKKLLSKGEIVWETVTYIVDGASVRFTGYVAHLDQSETFSLNAGESQVQLRVKMNGQVGSSDISEIDLDTVLSTTVL